MESKTTVTTLWQDTAQTYQQLAPGRAWLSYGDLRGLTKDVASQLRAFGIGEQDRVAIVLPV